MTRPHIIRAGKKDVFELHVQSGDKSKKPEKLGTLSIIVKLLTSSGLDTIDLQDQEAPSAKDHTRQPARPAALGEGPPAPHQADALKHVELEFSEQHGRSPRASQDLSGKELGLLHHEDGDSYGANDPEGNLLRNAGTGSGAEEEAGDADGDESLDDDMDKISSSPSIGDDGVYHLPLPLSNRGTPPSSPPTRKAPTLETSSDLFSSSPFYETPDHFPLSFPRNEREQHPSPSKVHHQQGRHITNQEPLLSVDDDESADDNQIGPLIGEISEHRASFFDDEGFEDMEQSLEGDLDINDFQHLLLPADDPLLDNSFDNARLSSPSSATSSPTSEASWDEGEPATADDDTEDISFDDNSRFVDSGWGGECLRETEDIDFEFVYALHTFVATVEGQANATKGDTMVLLDDSNSYWWLVRVVKDSSIGYLPAEHIETPLERLARLNKHRNLDLSQTMLGDEEEKKPGNPLNPLKKAMRRRNAKTVQFSAPSYVEPSDNDYSSEEEEEEGNGEYATQEQNGTVTQNADQREDIDNAATLEPLKSRGQVRDGNRPSVEEIAEQSRNGGPDQPTTAEETRTSEDNFDRADDSAASKSRKGTVRNTDSFFKDDSLETRKINLTPSLLRDDSSGPTTKPNELKTRVSLDSLEKDAPPEKGGKDDKKKKEKRGMLGGMFKRKDKRTKGPEKEVDEGDKASSDLSRHSPQPKESIESLSQEAQAARSAPQPHRQTSKLQKSPPAKVSPRSSNIQRDAIGPRPNTADSQSTMIPEPSRVPPTASESNESMRMVQPEQPAVTMEEAAPVLNFNPAQQTYEEPPQAESPKDTRRGVFSPIKDVLKSSPSEPKPEKARKAKQRMLMDDFDSSSEEEHPNEPPLEHDSHEEEAERHLAIAKEAQREGFEPQTTQPTTHTEPSSEERLSESPVEVVIPQGYQQRSPPQQQNRTHQQPPPLMVDTSSQEDPNSSPVSPAPSSTELGEIPPEHTGREETPASTTHSSTPTWSDASLRAYLEDDTEIRDLLVVVHDKSNIKPARRDHPIVQNMYKEENRKLGEISDRLDNLLGDYLARKGRSTTAVR